MNRYNLTKRLFKVVLDFAHFAITGQNPIKAFDREYCAAYEQFRDFPLSDIRAVVDVGAHDGLFSLRAARFFKSTRTILVEPLVEKKMQLENLKVPGAVVCSLALSCENGVRRFNINACRQASSLLSLNQAVSDQYKIPQIEEEAFVDVEVKRLDLLMDQLAIAKIDLLKLDVQGAELEVLRGCGDRIKDIRSIQLEMLFEEHYFGAPLFSEIHKFMTERGFFLNRLFDFSKGSDGRILQCDGWYINSGQIIQ